jgi:hypothetical protein
MFLKTNIPETTQCFTGRSVDFGDATSDRAILPDPINKLQAVTTLGVLGNRCGHVPNEPRFYHRPEHHKWRPPMIERAITLLESAFHFPKKLLTALLDLNPSKRRKRSERRETLSSVTQAILHYLDLETLRVGFYSESGTFVVPDIAFIAIRGVW